MDIEVTKSLLELGAAPFEAVPSKVVVEASPVNFKLKWILRLQNPYLKWLLAHLRLCHPKLKWRHSLLMLNCKGYWRCKILTWIGCCPCWYLLSRDKGCTHSCLDWIALTSFRCWSVAVAVAELEALATSCERFALGPISPVGPSNQPAWKVIIDYQNFTIWILLGK